MDHEQEDGRVKLESRALEPDTEGEVVVDPALREPVGHDGIHTERSGDGCSLKVLALASLILGQDGDSDVEASKASEAAQNEEGETSGIGEGAEAKSKGDHSGSNTK